MVRSSTLLHSIRLRGFALLSTLGIIGSLGGCNYAPYQRQMQISQCPSSGVWYANDPIHLEYFVSEVGRPHQLYIYLRHDNRYEYTTLPLQLTISYRDQWSASTHIALPLAQRQGRWSGQGYALQQHIYRCFPPIIPPSRGLYHIYCSIGSGVDSLVGIEQIGIAWVAT